DRPAVNYGAKFCCKFAVKAAKQDLDPPFLFVVPAKAGTQQPARRRLPWPPFAGETKRGVGNICLVHTAGIMSWAVDSTMNPSDFAALAAWVTRAGLIGRSESELMGGFCRKLAAAGIPLARGMVVLDTLHPIYEGRVFRWRADAPDGAEAVDYGRTDQG